MVNKSTCNIRNARPEDIPQLLEIIESSYLEHGLKTDKSNKDKDLISLFKFYQKHIFKVIEENEKIGGCYILFKKERHLLELRRWFLHPSFRGKGFGRLMLNDIVNCAKEANMDKLVLESSSKFKTAIHLYKSKGFKEINSKNSNPACDRSFVLNLKENE